jgi:RNA polymerase sigma-70 factor (ECF subfamily)
VTFPQPEFERFFHAHYDHLVRSLTVMTGDREGARDCVQDAFVKAAVRWHTVRRLDNPAAWVRRVAINRSRDVHRSSQARQRRETLAASQQLDQPDPATGITQSTGILELLQRLPAQQRRTATLYYLDDLPVADIAHQLGISTGAVKFHLHQARNTLRAAAEPVVA